MSRVVLAHRLNMVRRVVAVNIRMVSAVFNRPMGKLAHFLTDRLGPARRALFECRRDICRTMQHVDIARRPRHVDPWRAIGPPSIERSSYLLIREPLPVQRQGAKSSMPESSRVRVIEYRYRLI